jgi:hypothetical protein
MKSAQVLIVGCIFLLVSGCEQGPKPETKYSYTAKGKEKAAAFIEKCLAGANPKSDEEPEDWIPLCMKEARSMYGTATLGFYYWDSGNRTRTVEFVPCTKARTEDEHRLCGN